MTEEMPRNIIPQAEQPVRDDAALEAAWLKNNVPSEPLELRWRYENGKIQLFERHLRSLANYGIGPALRSYLRTRLEWVGDNKLYAQRGGVIVVTVQPNGDVDAQVAQQEPLPELSAADLLFEEGALAGASVPGSLWVKGEDWLVCAPQADQLKGACETFVRDLGVTLSKSMGYAFADRAVSPADLEGTEIFIASDEFGLVPVQGHGGPFTDKIQQCFLKLWNA